MKIARLVPVVLGAGTVFALAMSGAVASAESQAVRFEYTGGVQSFAVPDGVTTIHVEACGASGGVGANLSTAAGAGAKVVADVAVVPGETLEVRVGGQGGNGAYVAEGSTAPGGTAGFNGGAEGGASEGSNDLASGGGGGGASDLRHGGSGLVDRVLVAAGGGGSGAWTSTDDDHPAGPAGTGGNGGTVGTAGGGQFGGGGATQAAGGTATATADYDLGVDGASGTGGAGGAGTSSNSRGGGGGGGGLFGGAGGGSGDLEAGGGGGGGSSLAPAGTVTDGACTGDGYVEITYELPEVVVAMPQFTG